MGSVPKRTQNMETSRDYSLALAHRLSHTPRLFLRRALQSSRCPNGVETDSEGIAGWESWTFCRPPQ